MRFKSIVVAAGIVTALGTVCSSAGAAGQAADGHWVEAQSLRQLPAGVRDLLGAGETPDPAIADRGEQFNSSDVMIEHLPSRRFALGMVKGDTVVVAVERGGRGYSVQNMEFMQADGAWAVMGCVSTSRVPQRGEELLATMAHAGPDVRACSLPARKPTGR